MPLQAFKLPTILGISLLQSGAGKHFSIFLTYPWNWTQNQFNKRLLHNSSVRTNPRVILSSKVLCKLEIQKIIRLFLILRTNSLGIFAFANVFQLQRSQLTTSNISLSDKIFVLSARPGQAAQASILWPKRLGAPASLALALKLLRHQQKQIKSKKKQK